MANRTEMLKNSLGSTLGFVGGQLGKAIFTELPDLAHATGLINAARQTGGGKKIKQVNNSIPAKPPSNTNGPGGNINPAYLRFVGTVLGSMDDSLRKTLKAINTGNAKTLTQLRLASKSQQKATDHLKDIRRSTAYSQAQDKIFNKKFGIYSNSLMKSSATTVQMLRDVRTMSTNQKDILKNIFTTSKDLGKANAKTSKEQGKVFDKLLTRSNTTIEILKEIRKVLNSTSKIVDKTLDVNRDQLKILKDIERNTRNPSGTKRSGKGNSATSFGQEVAVAENLRIIDLLDHMDREMTVYANGAVGNARGKKGNSLSSVKELEGSGPMKLLTQQNNAIEKIHDDDVKVIDLLDYIRTDLAEIKTEDKKSNKFNQLAMREQRFNDQKMKSTSLAKFTPGAAEEAEKGPGMFAKLFAGANVAGLLKGLLVRTIIPGILGMIGIALLALGGEDLLLSIKHAYNQNQVDHKGFENFATNIMSMFFKMIWEDISKAARDYIPGVETTGNLLHGNSDFFIKKKADADAAHAEDVKNGRDPTSRMYAWIKEKIVGGVDDLNASAAKSSWEAQGRLMGKKGAKSSTQAANMMVNQANILDEGYQDKPSKSKGGNAVIAPVQNNSTQNTIINKGMSTRNPSAKDIQSAFVSP